MTPPLQIKDQQQIEEIVTLLKHTHTTGSFLFVTCSGSAAREMVEMAIREGVGQAAIIRVINLTEGKRDLAANIREELADAKTPPLIYLAEGVERIEDKHLIKPLKPSLPIYFIKGLPQVVAEEKAKQPDGLSSTLSQLNLSRDFFATNRLRLLFWLDEPTEQELFWKAGDLWAVRSGHWSFRDEADLKAKIAAEIDERAALFDAHDLRRRAEEQRERLQRYEKVRPDDRPGIPRTRRELADTLRLGEVEEARSILARALDEVKDREEQESLLLRGELLRSLGRLHLVAGQFQESEQTLQESLAIFRRLGDRRREAATLVDLGGLYRERGELARAETMLEEALTTFRQPGDPHSEAIILRELGSLYRGRGERARAETTIEEALAEFRRMGHTLNEARTLDALALVARDLKREAEAQRYTTEAERLFKAIGIAPPSRPGPETPALKASSRRKPKASQGGRVKRDHAR